MFANNPVIHISIGLFLGKKTILISVVLSYPTALSEFSILYHDGKHIYKTTIICTIPQNGRLFKWSSAFVDTR